MHYVLTDGIITLITNEMYLEIMTNQVNQIIMFIEVNDICMSSKVITIDSPFVSF